MAREPEHQSRWVPAVRYGLPGLIAAVGLGLSFGSSEVVQGFGVALTGMGVLVALANVFMRLSFRSGADRDREERAREFFDRHGRWPGRDEL